MSKVKYIELPSGQFLAAGTTLIDGELTPSWNYDPSFAIPFRDPDQADRMFALAKAAQPLAKLVAHDDPDSDDWNSL